MGYNPLIRGANPNISSRATSTGYQNGTGANMNACAPVSANTAGNIVYTDPSVESLVTSFVGLTQIALPSGASGQVVSDGRIENIPIDLGFAIGDAIYLGLTPGSLTNVKPDINATGWSEGMFVVFVGVVVPNEFDTEEQDIQLNRIIVGQL
jgi:hypothetical protein